MGSSLEGGAVKDTIVEMNDSCLGIYMVELNLKQIIDRLNAEFTGDTRKLVFWYDDNADFAEEIDTIKLQNAKRFIIFNRITSLYKIFSGTGG